MTSFSEEYKKNVHEFYGDTTIDENIKKQILWLIPNTILYSIDPFHSYISPPLPFGNNYTPLWDYQKDKWGWYHSKSKILTHVYPDKNYSFNLQINSRKQMTRKIIYDIEYNEENCPRCDHGHSMIILPIDFIEFFTHIPCSCNKCSTKLMLGKRWCCPLCVNGEYNGLTMKTNLCFKCFPIPKKNNVFKIESCDCEISNHNSEKFKQQTLMMNQKITNLSCSLTKEEIKNLSGLKNTNELSGLENTNELFLNNIYLTKDFRLNMNSSKNWFGKYIDYTDTLKDTFILRTKSEFNLGNHEIITSSNPLNVDLDYYNEDGTEDEDGICSIIAYGILENNPLRTCEIIKSMIYSFISYEVYSDDHEPQEVISKTASMIILYFNCLLFYCKERVMFDLIDLSLKLIQEHEIPFLDDNVINEISIGLNSDVLPLRPNITEVRGYIPHFMCLASTLSSRNIFEIIESSIRLWGSHCEKLDRHIYNIKERLLKAKTEQLKRITNLLFSKSLTRINLPFHIKKIKTDYITINDFNDNIFNKIMLKTIYSQNEIFIRKKVFILSLVCQKWWKFFNNNTPFYGEMLSIENYFRYEEYYSMTIEQFKKKSDIMLEKSKNFTWD